MTGKKKVIGTITNKEYLEISNNFKLEIITVDKQKLFFYSQQKHYKIDKEIKVNGRYLFWLFKGKKYWFLDDWEKSEEIITEIPEWLAKWKKELSEFNLKSLQEETEIKQFEQLEKRLSYLKEQINKTNSEEEVFLEYLEQFINLLLIKHLSIKEEQLTEKEKRERKILDKIVANWFYKTS